MIKESTQIKEYMYERNLKASELAKLLDICPEYLSKILNKKDFEPSERLIYKIRKLLSQAANVVMNESKNHKANKNSV